MQKEIKQVAKAVNEELMQATYVVMAPDEVDLHGDTVTEEEKSLLNISKNYFFPHKIHLKENGLEAEVLESRFAGNHYWNKIVINNIPLIMYSKGKVEGKINVEIES